MVSKVVIVIVILIWNVSNSQTVPNEDVRTIAFLFNKGLYEKIVKDSINLLYDRQKDYFRENSKAVGQNVAISLNYNFKELEYRSMPIYRLARYMQQEYVCGSNIEEAIVFNEYPKYQYVYFINKGHLLCRLNVPNLMFEYARIYSPTKHTSIAKIDYVSNYLQTFLAFPSSYNDFERRYALNINKNFCFKIMGLNGVIFEVDSETGVLYANYFGEEIDEVIPRMLANEFIWKYIGEKKIREIASGYYDDIDNKGTLENEPCVDFIRAREKIVLKPAVYN